MAERGCPCRLVEGNMKVRNNLEDIDVDGRLILK
jgi:hypothetical protein